MLLGPYVELHWWEQSKVSLYLTFGECTYLAAGREKTLLRLHRYLSNTAITGSVATFLQSLPAQITILYDPSF